MNSKGTLFTYPLIFCRFQQEASEVHGGSFTADAEESSETEGSSFNSAYNLQWNRASLCRWCIYQSVRRLWSWNLLDRLCDDIFWCIECSVLARVWTPNQAVWTNAVICVWCRHQLAHDSNVTLHLT